MKQPHIEEAIRRVLSRRRRNVPEPCPDANEFSAFLEKRLNSEESGRFEQHAADCAACREVLALSLQLDTAEERAAAPAVSAPRTIAYRTSPIRLIFAAAVVVVVGALLFQTTRQSRPTLQKSQISDRQSPRDVSGGSGAAVSSRENVSPSAPAPASPSGLLPSKASSEPAQARTERFTPKPQPVTAPGLLPVQPVPEMGQLSRSQAPVSADAARFAAAERARADLRQKANVADENRTSKMDLAASRPEEVKTKAEAVNVPAGQISQQASPANMQNAQLNQQAAADQVSANRMQTATIVGGRGGVVDLQTAEEKKQTESAKEAQTPQQGLPAKTGALAGGNQMLAMRSMMADAKGYSAIRALAEARPLVAKDSAHDQAKKIGERQFYRTANYWVDAECVAHPEAPVREISRDTGELAAIMGKETSLAALRALDAPIMLFWNGANYLIR